MQIRMNFNKDAQLDHITFFVRQKEDKPKQTAQRQTLFIQNFPSSAWNIQEQNYLFFPFLAACVFQVDKCMKAYFKIKLM